MQGKLKVLSQGIQPCIPSILDYASIVIDRQEWSIYFCAILTQEATILVFEDTCDIPYNNLIDFLFEAEIDLNKFIFESKEIMDARWTKATQNFKEVKTIEWPTKWKIYVWEVVG